MEELQKLEEIQSMMMFLHSQHFISSPLPDSHRFLSHFLLFLMEPCGNLSIDDKCSLISQHLPKVSTSLVEKALVGLPGKNEGFLRDCTMDDQVKDEIGGTGTGLDLGTEFGNGDMALIGLESMQRANSTLEDFCRSYFMFHEMDVTRPECLFKYLPVLSFSESYIYQLDSLNEKMVNVIRNKTVVGDVISNEEACKFMKTFDSEPFRPLSLLFEQHGLLTQRIREELRQGEEYWDLERKLCSTDEQISIEDVMRAIHLKSFDYRVLNLLLYQLQGEEVNDLHMEFLTVSELLVEISDDLFDYEEDVLENNFNILRMFVRIYGSSTAPAMLAKSIADAEEKYEKLAKALDPKLYRNYERRCVEATEEGGKKGGHPLGSWTIPPLIVDENLYRSFMQDCP